MRLHWNVGARSDVGLAREGNEDSLYAGPRLLVVADGVGGSVAGEVASAIAVDSLVPLDARAEIADPLDALADAIDTANDRLRTAIEADPSLTGMGTTLTALLWSDDRLGLAQLGDSRAYRMRAGTIDQLTRDQTLVQSLVDDGEITAEEALTHPRRSWILQALDGRTSTKPVLETLDTEAGDRFLLCSDGLSDYVAMHDIADALTVTDPQQSCDRMIDLALAVGAPDNVTCIVADLLDSGTGISSPLLAGAAAVPRRATGNEPVEQTEQPRSAGPDYPAPRSGRLARRLGLVAAVVLLLIVAAVAITVIYINHQWYVAPSAGKVAVYQGVQGKVGGHTLSSVHTLTNLPASALPQDDQDRLADGIKASSQDSANQVVDDLRTQACALITPAPTPTPTPKHHARHAHDPTPVPTPTLPAWCPAAS